MRMKRTVCALVLLAGCTSKLPVEEEGVITRARPLGSACGGGDWLDDHEDLSYGGLPEYRFRAPMSAFGDDALQAATFLLGLKPTIHLQPPFGNEHSVRLSQGWHYNSGTSHRAIDYSRDDVLSGADPTFAARAMADGVVRFVHPMEVGSSGGGNTVIVEHTAPDGTKILAIYMHLRNGKTHDWNIVMTTDTQTACEPYYKWALNNPNHPTWGTNAHAIPVVAGQAVKRGQIIGWVGNTGCGGIKKGLHDDGTPEDATMVNTHLHMVFAQVAPGLSYAHADGGTVEIAVMIDPYAIYDEEGTGCYDGLRPTTYERLIEPFHSSFHHVKYEDFKAFWGYFPKTGYSLATLSMSRDGGDVFANGSFQTGLGNAWATAFWYKGPDFDDKVADLAAEGLRPRETQVALASDGTPRFTAIFRPPGSGTYEYNHLMPEPFYVNLEQQMVVLGDYWVDDLFSYDLGIPTHAALFTYDSGGSPSRLVRNVPNATFLTTISGYGRRGWKPVNASVNDWGTFETNLIFKQDPNCWSLSKGMTSDTYQNLYEAMVGNGYRLAKLQSYDKAERYMAIFTRAPTGTPPTCP